MPEQTELLADFSDSFTSILTDIKNFFRYETANPEALKFEYDYYKKAADVMKKRIDFELKYLHSPYL